MVVLRTVHRSRRAASVPVGEPDLSVDHGFTTHNSLLFSKAAIDNTDALSSASRRHDQQFLHDLNSKLANSSFSKPAVKTVRKAYSHGAGSPLVARRRSIAVSSVLRPPPVATADDDPELDYEMHRIAPLTNRLARYSGRATSVPPLIGDVYHVPRHTVLATSGGGLEHFAGRPIIVSDDAEFYHTPATNEYLRHHLTSQQVEPTVTSSEYGQKLNPVADFAVRQAHRNLDRIERELKSSGDVIISRPLSPQYHRHRSFSYHGPRSSISTVRTRSVSPSPVAPSAATPPPRRHVRTTYVKGSAPIFSGSNEIDDYLFTSDYTEDPQLYRSHVYRAKTGLPISYSTLVPSSVKPLSSAKILNDVILHSTDNFVRPSVLGGSVKKFTVDGYSTPVYLHSVTPHKVVTYETINPHTGLLLHSATPSSSITTHSFAPLKPPVVPKKAVCPPPPPATQNLPPGLPQVTRPRVSETRRKVRDVLCKVKGDPHYFDY